MSLSFKIALSVLILLAGCTSTGLDRRPPLHVGVAPSYPPIIFERDGEILGIEPDLARIVADEIGRRLVFHRYALPELLDTLERGDVDVVMSGLSITPKRSARVLFTKPYLEVGQLSLIQTKEVGRLGRPRAIKQAGARVGYERGTTGEDFVAEQLNRAIAFAFDSVEEGLRSLRAGRIEFFIHDAPTIWQLAGDPAHRDLIGLYRPLTKEQLAWAVRKDEGTLRTQLNATLERLRREGLIEPIINRWIPVRVRVP